MASIPRAEILKKFRQMVAEKRPIVGGGAGTGLSAKSEEAGGIDLIVIYNSGRYRMAGRGSSAGLLAYGNANEIVKEMAVEVLPVVKRTPVLAGVNGTDPFILMPQFLAELKAMGFSGVQNFPTIGLFDGTMRVSFEETGMGYGLEVDMIRQAHEIDLLTTPYVFNPEEATAMTKAGADIVVAHMGVTTGASSASRTADLVSRACTSASGASGTEGRCGTIRSIASRAALSIPSSAEIRASKPSSPCSAWARRSSAIGSGSCPASATTTSSLGPAIPSMPTSPTSCRFASCTHGLPGPAITSTGGTDSVPYASAEMA
jgi:predicted TIM-barrel enzyme